MSDDFKKIMMDAIVHGKVFVRDGTAIPLDEVYIDQDEKMTDDLVTRLRAWAPLVAAGYEVPAAGQSLFEAADRIEQLEAALRDVIKVAEAEYCTLTDGEHGSLFKWHEPFQRAHRLLEEGDGQAV